MTVGNDGNDDAEKGAEQKREKNLDAPTIKKRLGEFLILLIYLLVEGYGVWPVSHGWCLASFAVGVPALLLLDGASSWRSVAVVTITTCVICIIVYFLSPSVFPEETEGHGWLLPSNQSPLENDCTRMSNAPQDALVFDAGGNVLVSTKPGGVPIISLDGGVVVSVERSKARLRLNADIHNKDGLLVARITQNEFHLIPGQFSYQIRSVDRSELTVFDGVGNEVFYIDYANRNTVYLRGIFIGHNGTRVEITKDEMRVRAPGANANVSDMCQASSQDQFSGFAFSKDGTAF